jgi:hypothetical protein
MLFLCASGIPVNPQIHANVMCPRKPIFEEKNCYLYIFNMNIDQMKRAIHIRCTQQFFYLLFLHANVIPVNPQIHANVMRPLFVLNYIFEPLFVHVPDIVHFLKFLLSTLVNKICWYCKCGTDRKYREFLVGFFLHLHGLPVI